jgi:hypothetical protein
MAFASHRILFGDETTVVATLVFGVPASYCMA